MISGNLEYILCSLPHLTFQDSYEERSKVFSFLQKYAGPLKEKMSLTEILEGEVMKYLSASDFQIFRQIDLKSIHSEVFMKSKHSVLAAFSTYVCSLKSEVQQLRISRKKGSESSSNKRLQLPLVPGNPLEEEIQLLKFQWKKLEDLSIGHYADFEAVCLYKLKFLILLRWWSFDREKGFDVFQNITKRN
jgi:hypothetical protein